MKILFPLFCCLPLLLSAQDEAPSSKELLRTGLFEEEVNQDHKKAEAAYQKVTERYDQERYFAGLAFFRLAEIARKSGDQKKAAELYQRVAREFSDQKEIAKRALVHLGD
ncbi:tetratricopeptide repeat protein [bacterium]|nr:tetratricopeptide repeat protein [bacterium]MDB4466082.1 tetratricopeptide repeat protein [bacterium]